MRALVCGGRDYRNRAAMFAALDKLHAEQTINVLIHGGARGADSLAGEWAKARSVSVLRFPAQWQTHGKAAGPIRNKQMLAQGLPDVVIAFAGGAGTANMITQSAAAGVRIVRIHAPPIAQPSEPTK